MNEFRVRFATPDDAPLLAQHRARMFHEMGLVPDEAFQPFRSACEPVLRQMLETGEYVGWLLSTKDLPNDIVAGAGVQLRRVLPHPARSPEGGFTIGQGRHAIIINVFTEPEWRRRGAARFLMERIIAWSSDEKLDRLVLHASDAGRLLYKKLGFVPTNEMRYQG